MKTKVGEFKGFDIFFDNDNEAFSVEGYDNSAENKKSYNACKTYINKFVKENEVFGEFKLVSLPSRYHDDKQETITVKGIHGNGNFLCEKEDGSRFQISTGYRYEMEKWCTPEDFAKSDYDQSKVDKIEDEISVLRDKISKEKEKLPKDCSELLKKVKEEYKYLWA